MDNIKHLETQYLRAKIAYYEGKPIMSDAAFDIIEKALEEAGSKVVEQVGAKRKDFDFAHPTRMRSLSKLQTEKDETGATNYMEEDFNKWYVKRRLVTGDVELGGSPKFDGSAINIIYHKNEIFQVLTRGDGNEGKEVTKRFIPHIPNSLNLDTLELNENDILEVRCEVVIDKNLFNKKYKGSREEGKYANPRNYVAGVIGKDDFDEVKVSELKIVPLHFLLNGKNVSQKHFSSIPFYSTNWNIPFIAKNYVDVIKEFEKKRDSMPYPLDGVVISFPENVREKLGENDHHPHWAIAVKFISDETIAEVIHIEWNLSKRGEVIPVIILKPVELMGTTVQRVSGYNAKYIVNNRIKKGALLSIHKSGDIIPEILNVVYSPE